MINTSLLPPGSRILVAVSGGADSVALLHALKTLSGGRRWRLTVAHLHHGIRGLAADEDARFVERTAAQLKLPCVLGKARVPALARRRGISLEMAAREARYTFLLRTARRVKADVIATAHTADDQAETVLLRLVRGAGRAGLSGISAETALKGCRLVRPLLDVSRRDILSYLRREKLAWREDESNADSAFLRNRVRHQLIPLLERDFNPRIREALSRTRRILADEEAWLEELTGGMLDASLIPSDRAAMPRRALSCRLLLAHPLAAQRRVIRMWLMARKAPESCFDFETLDRILALCGGARGSATLLLGEGWAVRRAYDRLTVDRILPDPAGFRVRVSIPGETLLPDPGWRIVARLEPGLIKERPRRPGIWPARASLCFSTGGRQPLYVRSWQPGDRMAPFGMKGSKKIQDILVDAKVPRQERPGLPLFESGGEIVWLPGYRVAAARRVTDPGVMNLQLCVEPLHGGNGDAVT
ncbi:MAG: tRNA lysidine(34) synthetase TilS [bacterium]